MPRHLLLFAILGYLAVDKIQARSALDCFFVDGKSLCGQDGILARQQLEQSIIEQTRQQHLKADRGELPQGDDPRFESRVAYTGRADTNEKGQPRPEKGQPRPPPCPPPPVTTTTTEPPCPPPPVTTTTTTTAKPLSPCELARMRQHTYGMNDQPQADQPQSDQPVEDRPQFRTVVTEAPVVEEPRTTASSMMNSRMPDYARNNANWGGLRLYHTFQDPVYNSAGSTTANNRPANARNNFNDNNRDDGDYGFY